MRSTYRRECEKHIPEDMHIPEDKHIPVNFMKKEEKNKTYNFMKEKVEI